MKASETKYKHFSKPLNTILYLINFVLLLSILFSVTALIEATVREFLVTDTSKVLGGSFDQIALSIATLIISAPLYLGILFYLRRGEKRYPLIINSYARKITYVLIAIITFCYLIGVLIAIVFSAIQGNINPAGLITSFGTASINVVILGYYLIQLRK